MKKRLSIFVLSLLLPALSLAQGVVVWDFTTRGGDKTDTTASFTHEFEEALVKIRKYTVLERRNFARLQAVIENEKTLQNIGQVSPAGSRALEQLGASLVAFGEIFYDGPSGDVTIKVTLQNFKGEQLAVDSVLMRQGLLSDATSRREKMTALAQAISGGTEPARQQTTEQDEQEIKRPCAINDTFQCAARLPFEARDDDAFRDVHDKRYYQFKLVQPGKVKLTLDPMPDSRFVDIVVYDAEYTEISRKHFGAGKPGNFLVKLGAPGLYYAVLEPGSCCSGAPLTYGFAVSLSR